MISLSQYFEPHTFRNLLFFVYLLFTFDIAGWGLTKFLRITPCKSLRPTLWFFGMAQTTFLMFLSHLFTFYNGQLLLLFSTLIILPWIKSYFHTNQHKELFRIVKDIKILLLIFLPLIPLVFVKTSLPPYVWDEAAYHYISPHDLFHQKTWSFHGLYENLPRLLDTIYIHLFSLTKSYASARLLHFFIYFSLLITTYLFIKKQFNTIAALISFCVLSYLQIPLIIQSTWGYIDVATASFVTLAVLTLLHFTQKPSKNSFFLGILYLSIGIGIKYNALAPSIIIGLLFLIFIYLKRYFYKIRIKEVITVILVGLFLGGYWYVKNWVVTGNPIYPFIFPCRVSGCGVGQSFFGSWTEPLTLGNLPLIIKSVLFNHHLLTPAAVIIILFSLIITSKRNKKTLILLLGIVFGEYFLLSPFAGFEDRYFFHWNIILSVTFSISLYLTLKFFLIDKKFTLGIPIFLILAFLTIFVYGKKTITLYRDYLPDGINYYQTRFALGRADIKNWISLEFPEMKEFVFFCDDPPKNQPITYAWIDPDLIWYSRNGLVRVFMTNCKKVGNPFGEMSIEEIITYAVDNQIEFIIPSLNPCTEADKINMYGNEDDYKIYLRKLNNEIVCHSKEVETNVYLFSPTTLKNQEK